MSTLPSIAVRAGALTVAADVLRAVARRVDWRGLGWGTLLVLGLVLLSTFGLVTMFWGAPPIAKVSRVVHTSVAALFVAAAVLVADEAVTRGLRPLPTYAGAILLGAVLGSLVGFEVRGALGLNYGLEQQGHVGVPPRFAWVRRIDVVLVLAIVASLATFAHVSRRNALAARRRQHEAEAARARAQRRTLESQLQALQARVEPGFLFETLDRISGLYATDAVAADAMLEDLIAYLRAALPHLRESASTVRQELALASAWLDIMRRSTTRLEVAVDVAPDVAEARLPALVMLPLVQRALSDAGSGVVHLHLSAGRRDERLRVVVETSTPAFGAASAETFASLAERLQALYATQATLAGDATPSGSRATLEIPLEARVESPLA
jgi:hypothetical protein